MSLLVVRRLLLCCALILPGCSSGIAEFGQYAEAFEAQHAQGSDVVDRFARAERTVMMRIIVRRGEVPGFRPEEAAYFVEAADPPVAASIRATVTVLRDYNLALAALASGETDRATVARFAGMAANIAAAAAALDALPLAAKAASDTDGNALAAVTGEIAAALPVVNQLATLAGRAAFRREFLAAEDDMQSLLLTLRAATPAMFAVMERAYVVPGNIDTDSGIPLDDLPRLEADRIALAGWVVLIDRTRLAMSKAAAAARAGPFSSPAGLLEASVELRVLAEQIRAAGLTP
jgi:hypothetical protein